MESLTDEFIRLGAGAALVLLGGVFTAIVNSRAEKSRRVCECLGRHNTGEKAPRSGRLYPTIVITRKAVPLHRVTWQRQEKEKSTCPPNVYKDYLSSKKKGEAFHQIALCLLAHTISPSISGAQCTLC